MRGRVTGWALGRDGVCRPMGQVESSSYLPWVVGIGLLGLMIWMAR